MSAHPRRLVLACLVLLGGCAGMAQRASDWPEGLPARGHYERLYALDHVNQASGQTLAEYLLWVRRFYTGWGPQPDGWHATAAQILAEIDPTRYAVVHAELAMLGTLISGEWAKLSPARVIRNRTVAVWGEALAAASIEGEYEPLIDRVRADVLALLDGTLDPQAITRERYQLAPAI